MACSFFSLLVSRRVVLPHHPRGIANVESERVRVKLKPPGIETVEDLLMKPVGASDDEGAEQKPFLPAISTSPINGMCGSTAKRYHRIMCDILGEDFFEIFLIGAHIESVSFDVGVASTKSSVIEV